MIVVDYLQLMAMGGNVEESAAGGLLALARPEGAREGPRRPDHRPVRGSPGRSSSAPTSPVLSDLRESGSIEQDADLVMFIYRDEYYNGEESEQQGLAEVHVAKHRNGPTETIKLNFVKRYAKFSDHRAA